jgi:hypothetical protein
MVLILIISWLCATCERSVSFQSGEFPAGSLLFCVHDGVEHPMVRSERWA